MPVPASTCCTLPPISPLISRAAEALRCARLRTSVATTAKPRPCSPARAASTAAFSARMLVWKAMPSMVPMISAICADERADAVHGLHHFGHDLAALGGRFGVALRRARGLVDAGGGAVGRWPSSAPSKRPDSAGWPPPARCGWTGPSSRWRFRHWTARSAGLARARATMPRSESCMSRKSRISSAASSLPRGVGGVVRSPRPWRAGDGGSRQATVSAW
jgi:hypothetical protein